MSGYDKYILKAVAVPLLIILCITMMLLLLDQFIRLLDFILEQNGQMYDIVKMLVYLLPEYLGTGLPFAVLGGCLLSIHGLSHSNELDAILASGVSPGRVLKPLIIMSVVIMAANFILQAYIQPYSEYAYKRIGYEVQNNSFRSSVKTESFINFVDGITLRFSQPDQNIGSSRGFIESCPATVECTVISSDSTRLLRSNDNRQLVLDMGKGRQFGPGIITSSFEVMDFNSQRLILPLPEIVPFRSRGQDEQEIPINEQLKILLNEDRDTFAGYQKNLVNFHWRILFNLPIFLLPYLAFAFSLTSKRRESAIGVVFAVLLLIVYIQSMQTAKSFSIEAGLSPFAMMYPIYAIFTGIVLFLYQKTCNLPGFLPSEILLNSLQPVMDFFLYIKMQLKGKRV